jgi:hypothetical protein
MVPTANTSQALEMAHVLFLDIVGFSLLPMTEERQMLRDLQPAVLGTAEFTRAQRKDQLISLPTGDGMALVFFGDLEAPVQCALELSRTLETATPQISLRMGVHTGPVHRIADINSNSNEAGGGINVAQRVMDCGDAGHILVSGSVADVLYQIGNWATSLHDLGEVEVKHGQRIRMPNLYGQGFGNTKIPGKVKKNRPEGEAALGPTLPDPMINRTVSHYRILKKLGGGMGIVYEAQDQRLGRRVALRFLPEDRPAMPSSLERFQQEACASSSLNHPNICTVHDVGDFEGRYFIVMELLEGETLKHRMIRKQLSDDEILQATPSMFARSDSAGTITSPDETEAGTAGTQPC